MTLKILTIFHQSAEPWEKFIAVFRYWSCEDETAKELQYTNHNRFLNPPLFATWHRAKQIMTLKHPTMQARVESTKHFLLSRMYEDFVRLWLLIFVVYAGASVVFAYGLVVNVSKSVNNRIKNATNYRSFDWLRIIFQSPSGKQSPRP